ncbi:MAG: D-glycero-beta-D-manno-heptose 1,7-bisphosphate 7-phosphatase [Candidatus Omnitrophica bacterium]|nr:D-glycero-beta-D-manno-heptose 1,7-bisphosphate 7-phosphatase [Candidatus Omnitrophota bacterium]
MKAIFLDRDGVINRDPGGGDYIKSWKEFEFWPGSIEAIKKLNEKGYEIFVISNQAGVGRGIYSQASLDDITKNMLSEIKKQGGKIRSVSYCTHKPDAGCECRKPKIGMIKKATEGLDIDFKNTYFIGDSHFDVGAGNGMGCKTILLLTGKEDPDDVKNWALKPDLIKKDLREAVEWILKQERG